MLNFSITIKTGTPIYGQVIYAVKKAIVSGQLRPGDPFPSVRELGRELNINPNTARKIVSYLAQTGMLEIKPGIGSVIHGYGDAKPGYRQIILGQEIEKIVVEAKRAGIEKKDVIQAFNHHWEKA
ncbi:MAG: GntR family transcriptional regulator [Candidatus Omnitrophota bacterium]